MRKKKKRQGAKRRGCAVPGRTQAWAPHLIVAGLQVVINLPQKPGRRGHHTQQAVARFRRATSSSHARRAGPPTSHPKNFLSSNPTPPPPPHSSPGSSPETQLCFSAQGPKAQSVCPTSPHSHPPKPLLVPGDGGITHQPPSQTSLGRRTQGLGMSVECY